MLLKEFTLREDPKEAVCTASALGLYRIEINGKRVGEAFMTPGFTDYRQMLQVQQYDVADLLKKGKNHIEMTVNAGWYSGRFGLGETSKIYGDAPAGMLSLEVRYADGKKEAFATDERWEARESHIRFSGIYDGEIWDFTKECNPLTPVAAEYDESKLVSQMCESVKNIERIGVKRIFYTPKGELVYDFGQNLTGVAEVKTDEDFDGTLVLTFAEALDGEGNFYTENLRSAKATDKLTGKGAHTFAPEFTFHGFRYMRVQGAKLREENVCALVRHTDMKRTGSIRTDSKLFNRLLENAVWSQRDNFLDIPTDCPQRDERLGWTGDINVFCRTAAYNYDIRAFMKKWLATLRQEQLPGGEIPHVIPDVLGWSGTDAVWGDCVTMIPWTLYRMYGEESFLSENYGAMKKFLQAVERSTENGLVMRGHQYGDWLALDGEKYFSSSCRGGTDEYFIANVFYAVSLGIVAETAKILGDEETSGYCAERRKKLLSDMEDEYFTARGRLACDTVTARVLLLHFGLVPERRRKRLARELNDMVAARGYHVTTGFAGTPYLLFALADNGYAETAEKVLFNETYPGWLYEVKLGATTIWERWNGYLSDGPNREAVSMNSYNHYAYGSFMEYVYRRITGIEASAPGFGRVKISPQPCQNLLNIRAEYDSVHGKILSGYEINGKEITYYAEIPEGVQAEIYLPGSEKPEAVGGGKYTFVRETASAFPGNRA